MALISGQPIGPDGLGGAFHNTLESRRAWVWRSLGGKQGVLAGLESANVPGQLQRSYSPGIALLEERDAAGNVDATGRGYTAGWDEDDGDQIVAFAVPDASARSDAVVIAVCDTSVGAAALGTAVSEVGPQLVVVRGVSGTTTPRTDAQINAAVGSGAWLRLDDVLLSPGDAEVSDAAVTRSAASTAVGAARARASLSADQTNVVAGTNTQVRLDRADYDTTSMFASNGFTVPVDGCYTGKFHVQWSGGGDNSRKAWIEVNGTIVSTDFRSSANGNTLVFGGGQNVEFEQELLAGDVVKFWARHESSQGALTVLAAIGGTWATLRKVD